MVDRLKFTAQSIIRSILLVAVVIVVLGFVLLALAHTNGINQNNKPINELLTKVPQRSLVSVNLHTAPELIPPTNRWFSSLAFQQPSNPVFAWPLALQLSTKGFTVSQPQIHASANTINAPFTADLSAVVADSVEQTLTGYDDLSASFKLTSHAADQLSGRITRGSPYLYIRLEPHKTLSLSSSSFVAQAIGNNHLIFTAGDISYGISSDAHGQLKQSANGVTLTTDSQASQLTIFAIPHSGDPDLYFKYAADPIMRSTATTSVTGSTVNTTFDLKTAGGHDTLLALLPSDQTLSPSNYGSFNTLEGTQTVQLGKNFSSQVHFVAPNSQLAVDKLSSEERAQLSSLIRTDARTLSFTKDDSYFAGKELYRAAELLQLAEQMNLHEQAALIQSKLKQELTTWFDVNGSKTRTNKYFYYDNELKGLVAAKSSFGSESFNDHHFQYGYFIDAAALLGRYDSIFLHANKAFVDLLSKDIINTDRSDLDFPYQRTFDSYVGHSWASGFGNFSDGQNQESSSEAVHAWAAAYQWAQLTGNNQLKTSALALYARESHAATHQWLTKPPEPEYAHSIVSLVWSGKLDYATFFNGTPEAKLGIQLIPMSPANNYLKTSGGITPSAVIGLNTELAGAQPTVFKDFLVMYQAMYDPDGAKQQYTTLQPKDLDDATSMSYLYAWVHTPH